MTGHEWRLRANCRGAEPTKAARAFGGATEQKWFINEFCRRCEVQVECGEFAVRIDADGVFGGTTRRRRADLGLVPRASNRSYASPGAVA